MIYTVTLNPAVDYVVSLDALAPGKLNRAASEHVVFGGKGVNVSLMLHALNTPSVALGFTAGFTGEAIRAGVEAQGIRTDFVALESGFSRINVKLHAGDETEINGCGPEIPEDKLELFLDKLRVLTSADTLVLSGSVPPALPDNVYARIASIAAEKGARLVVDTAGKLLLSTLPYRPFLIKPNREELSALLCTASGESYRVAAAKGTVVNSVGAGDSMVGGFLAAFQKTGSLPEALALGAAAGGATAFSVGIADFQKVMALYERLRTEVTRIG